MQELGIEYFVEIGVLLIILAFCVHAKIRGPRVRQRPKKLLRLRTRYDDGEWEEPAIPPRQPELPDVVLKLPRRTFQTPNKSPEPTPVSVTPRAIEGDSK